MNTRILQTRLPTQIEWFPCFIPFFYTDTNAAFAVTVLYTFRQPCQLVLNLRFELRHKQGLSLSPLPIGIVKQIVLIHILATQRRDIHLLVLRCPPHPTLLL